MTEFKQKMTNIAMNVAQNSAATQGLSKSVTPDEITILVPFDPNASSYEIFLDEGKGKEYPLSKPLKYRDMIAATSLAIGILKVPIRNGKEAFSANQIQYFADPNHFNVAIGAADLSEAEALNSLYHGWVSLQVNEKIKLQKLPMARFQVIHTTQNSGTTKAESVGAQYQSLGGVLELVGGDDNKLVIDIKCIDKTHINADASSNNYIVVSLAGAAVKGSTTARNLR